MFLVLLLCYRDTISILIYNNTYLRSLFYLYESESADKKFDIFISYSHFDKDFVEDYMVPKLEDNSNNDELKYTCLIQEREFVPGQSMPDQISEAIDSSSCTMIILSYSFVESQWALYE